MVGNRRPSLLRYVIITHLLLPPDVDIRGENGSLDSIASKLSHLLTSHALTNSHTLSELIPKWTLVLELVVLILRGA